MEAVNLLSLSRLLVHMHPKQMRHPAKRVICPECRLLLASVELDAVAFTITASGARTHLSFISEGISRESVRWRVTSKVESRSS